MLHPKYFAYALDSESKLDIIVRNARYNTTMFATFSTLWPPSWHADVTASVCMFRYATPSVRRELCSMEVTYFALAGWNRCFHTRLGIQVVLHPLRVPSAPFTCVCRGDFARYVIGSDNE